MGGIRLTSEGHPWAFEVFGFEESVRPVVGFEESVKPVDRIITVRNGKIVVEDCILCVKCQGCDMLCGVKEIEIVNGHSYCEECRKKKLPK